MASDEQLDALFDKVRERYGRIDTLVHSVAYANREDLGGRFIDISPRRLQHGAGYQRLQPDRHGEARRPLMSAGGSMLSMTYFASEKVMPRYHVMAVAKAALENITRYLANDLGPQGIRVNAISAGPIKTLSAAGVPGFRTMLRYSEQAAPLRRTVSADDVGNTALWLSSELGSAVTGVVVHVDAGYNILGLTLTEEDLEKL